MDTLKEIEKQVRQIKELDNSSYVDQIFVHLERAEVYYKEGEQDQHYYNDVIYRSNQAYEGALKEAYKVLAAMNDEQLIRATPFKIEAYFKQHAIFKERVLTLFENYRQEWRNTSTHDFKLVFNESEAFIALMSVSSFVHLLLKQIHEKISFNFEQERLERERTSMKKLQNLVLKEGGSLADKVVKVLFDFSKRDNFLKVRPIMMENELRGTLHAYLVSAGFRVIPEPSITYLGKRMVPDFVIENEQEKIVLVTAVTKKTSRSDIYSQQLLNYLIAAKVGEGVFFNSTSMSKRTKPELQTMQATIEGTNYVLHMINA